MNAPLRLLGVFPALFTPVLLLAQPSRTAPEEIVTLSEFEVRSQRDFGYRATNSMTATRTGVEIAKIPVNVSVITSELLSDIAAENLNDGLQYISSVSTATLGNNGRVGGSGDGTRIRGFQTAFALRNGFRRDRNVSVRNVERIEVVKGPVSQLFGQTTPGGLINYITKRPTLNNAASVRLTTGSDSLIGGELDVERTVRLFRKGKDDIGLRFMTSAEERDLARDFEFTRDLYLIGQLAWQPSDKFDVLFEHEYLDRASNLGQGLPRWNPQHVADWQAALAAGRTSDASRWYSSINNWVNDSHARTGVRPRRNTGFRPDTYPAGAMQTFNLGGPDQRFNNKSHSTSVEARWEPVNEVAVRYGFNRYLVEYFEIFNFNDAPSADNTFLMSNLASRNNRRVISTNQVDAVFKHRIGGASGTLVAGVELLNDYETNRRIQFDPVAGFQAQGITRAIPAPGQPDRGATLNAVNSFDPRTMALPLLNLQVVRMDNPSQKTVTEIDRSGYYASYRLSLFDDRLNTFAGARHEEADTSVFSPFTNVRTTSSVGETTPSFGASFQVVKGATAFVGYSESFSPSAGVTATGALAQQSEVQPLPTEVGEGLEAGIKLDVLDGTLSGTISYFNVKRRNISSLDFDRTERDPRNADPSRPTGVAFPYRVTFFAARGSAVSEGVDADIVWQPRRNTQLLLSVSHYLRAEFEDIPPISVSGLNATGQSVTNRVDVNGARLPRTPDWALSVWGKHTFVDGPASGLSLGLGAHYRDAYLVFGAPDTNGNDNPLTVFDERGLVSNSYVAFDATLAYPVKLAGRTVDLSLTVKNATDKLYIGGTYTYAEPRRFILQATTRF